MRPHTRAAVAATAALALLTLAGCGAEQEPTATDPGPSPESSSSSPTDEPSRSEPSATSPTSASPAPTPVTVPAYFIGDTPQGPRLFREFQRAEDLGPGQSGLALLEAGPRDPDYRSLWPAGAFASLSDPEAGQVDVTLADPSYGSRPDGMSRAEARMAVEQVIFTLQAGFQERLAVQFRIGDNPTARVYGVPTSEPLANGAVLETLALVSVTTPEQGATVSGSFTASGVASSFEATVPWEIRQGGEVVERGFSTAEGWMDKLYPWTTEVDVSRLEPGDYEFVALTDDPSGGAEGGGPTEDSKVITVE